MGFSYEVRRQIPPHLIRGIRNHELKIYGGVIRYAAGTPYGGRIAGHLIDLSPASEKGLPLPKLPRIVDYITRHQLTALNASDDLISQRLLGFVRHSRQASNINPTLSLLNVPTLVDMVRTIETYVGQLASGIREIQTVLNQQEQARLYAALDNMGTAEAAAESLREKMLDDARYELKQLESIYTQRLEAAASTEAYIVLEEQHSLAALAQIRCRAELDMMDVARREFQNFLDQWTRRARDHAQKILLGSHPERFLLSDYAETVPTVVVTEWMDFAHGVERGYEWVDELRAKLPSWGEKRGFKLPGMGGRSDDKERDHRTFIPALNKLVARHNVYEGYGGQIEMLPDMDPHHRTPSQQEEWLKSIRPDSLIGGQVFLEGVYHGATGKR